MKEMDITPDHILSDKDFEKVSSGIDSQFRGKTVFESLKNSCKRSRQNFKTLAQDLVGALLGKKKENKK